MTQLYPPERHETLLAIPWNEGAVRAAIEAIVDDTRAAASPYGLWPVHPKDGEARSPRQANLYVGAAGVIWALDHLTRQGSAEAGPSMAQHLSPMRVRTHDYMQAAGLQTRSYLIADAGLLLAEWHLAPSPRRGRVPRLHAGLRWHGGRSRALSLSTPRPARPGALGAALRRSFG